MEASLFLTDADRELLLDEDGQYIDYSPFLKAMKEGDRKNIETFIKCHPEALITRLPEYNSGTALHYMLSHHESYKLEGGKEILALLVDQATPDHLAIVDEFGDTPLATAIKSRSCPVEVLKLMVDKNPYLANLGDVLPVYLASQNKLEDMTQYLYGVTDKSILLSMGADTMTSFLKNLVRINLFGIASDIMQDFPKNLRGRPYPTIPALARKCLEDDGIDYTPFYKAIKEGDKNNIATFIECHPQALTTGVPYYDDDNDHDCDCEGTALHYRLRKLEGGEEMVALLVDRMTPDHLEIEDSYCNTPLVTAIKSRSCPVDVLKLMVNKNPKLANIGDVLPVFLASRNKLRDMTHYLYGVTDNTTLLSMEADKMSSFLKNLVRMNLFGIASVLLQDLPYNIRRRCPYRTVTALARECHEDDGLCIDYSPFYKAIKEGDRNNIIETFLKSNPQALSIGVPYDDDDDDEDDQGTALHYVLRKLDKLEGGEEIVTLLVDLMTPDHLEIVNKYRNTPLVTAIVSGSCPIDVVKLMVNKNPNLANIGDELPVYLASENMLQNTTKYLYIVTDKSIMRSMKADRILMSSFLKNLVHMNLFGIASDILLQDFPNDCPYHIIPALARKFSATGCLDIRSDALGFLRSVLSVQSSARDKWFNHETYCDIIVENAESGYMEFVQKLFQIRPDILKNGRFRAIIFVHAILKREKNIFNLIYPHIQHKDFLEQFDTDLNFLEVTGGRNILHVAAELAPSNVLNRSKSGAVLQMQSEIQWFKAVWDLACPDCREARNSDNFTPHELFIERHKSLKEAGEKSMKEIAQSCTVVGALIVTIMFAAAFTVPGGNDQNTGLPLFLNTVMFKVFIICDAISLYSSTTSVLACLGILMSRYAEQDFLEKLPRRLMISLSTLFFSVATMMAVFCAALTIMLDGNLQLILPVVLLALVPIVIFLVYTGSLLYDIYTSTYRSDIVDKNNRKLMQTTKDKKPMIRQSSAVNRKLSTRKRGEIVV